MKKEKITKANEYICEICGNTYKKGWSNEEAEQEANDIWGEIPLEEKAIICDDCFNKRNKDEIREMGNEYKQLKTKR